MYSPPFSQEVDLRTSEVSMATKESKLADDCPKQDAHDNGGAKDISGSKSTDKDAFKVFVGGLPFRCEKDAIREHFSQCGDVEWFHVPGKANGKPQGIAFISFYDEDAVRKAIALDGSDFMGLPLKVNRAGEKPAKKDPKEREVFIGGIPFSCTRATLKTDFSECGEIVSMSMPMHSESRSKGIVFITFKTTEGVTKALAYDGTQYGGCKLTVRKASEKPEYVPKASKASKTNKVVPLEPDVELEPFEVIVKGLPFATKEDAVKEAFSACGDIKRVRMPVNKRGKCHGFAFVAFTEKKGMKRSLKLDGTEVAGREVHVERVRGKDDEASVITTEKATTITEDDTAPIKKRPKPPEEEDDGTALKDACKKDVKRLKSSETDAALADDASPSSVRRKVVPEGISQEELLERTIANREKRKAKRQAR